MCVCVCGCTRVAVCTGDGWKEVKKVSEGLGYFLRIWCHLYITPCPLMKTRASIFPKALYPSQVDISATEFQHPSFKVFKPEESGQ